MVFLVIFVIFILFFLRSICRCRLEGFAQDRALPHQVVALGVDWASLVVENLVELILRLVALLTTQGAIHSADCIVRLALARRIPLVARASTVVVALPIVVVVAAGEALRSCSSSSAQRCIISRKSTTILGRFRPKLRYRDWTVMLLWK